MRIPAIADVTAALRTLVPSSKRALPITDTQADPGLFGPGSVTWRVMAEPVLMLGAGRALLMQAAHPLVAEGAIEHSTYRSDPYGRFERTVHWVTVVCFGTTAEARRACREVNRLHGAVEGRIRRSHSTATVASGSAYSGRDPALLRWVLATFVDTMLVAHDAFVGTLTEPDRDRFVREWHAVAALMGMPAGSLWESRTELSAYVAAQLERGGGCGPRGRVAAGRRDGAQPADDLCGDAPGMGGGDLHDRRAAAGVHAARLWDPLDARPPGRAWGDLAVAPRQPDGGAATPQGLTGVRQGAGAGRGTAGASCIAAGLPLTHPRDRAAGATRLRRIR